MKRLFSTGSLMTMAIVALALAPAAKLFDSTYGIKPDSTLGKARCSVCHASKMGGKKLNRYGLDMQKAMRQANSKTITAEILHKIDALDSDGDGAKNIDEIKADRTPGG